MLLMVGDMLRNLKDSIVDYDLNLLRAIARMRGFELRATRQAPAVEELAGNLVDQAATDWIWSRLSDEAREAVETSCVPVANESPHLRRSFWYPTELRTGQTRQRETWLDRRARPDCCGSWV